jgi:sulfur-oxidizing protein SoxY
MHGPLRNGWPRVPGDPGTWRQRMGNGNGVGAIRRFGSMNRLKGLNVKQHSRRDLLKQASLLATLVGCGMLTARQALAAEASGFDAKTLGEALKSLGSAPADSKEVSITSPDIAENGAVVPVAVTSRLPKTQEIYILVEKNPNPLTASFTIPDGTEPFVSTRVKMGQSSNIYAVVKADGKLYSTVKETKVTLGGCGG